MPSFNREKYLEIQDDALAENAKLEEVSKERTELRRDLQEARRIMTDSKSEYRSQRPSEKEIADAKRVIAKHQDLNERYKKLAKSVAEKREFAERLTKFLVKKRVPDEIVHAKNTHLRHFEKSDTQIFTTNSKGGAK